MATEGERAHADAVINLCFEYIAGRCSATAHDSNLACEFSDAPLKLRRGTRLRSRHRHDTRGHAVLGAMSAFTLLVEVPAPMRAATPILPALREAVRREYGLECRECWPPL